LSSDSFSSIIHTPSIVDSIPMLEFTLVGAAALVAAYTRGKKAKKSQLAPHVAKSDTNALRNLQYLYA
jgi:hypothetical protein